MSRLSEMVERLMLMPRLPPTIAVNEADYREIAREMILLHTRAGLPTIYQLDEKHFICGAWDPNRPGPVLEGLMICGAALKVAA